MNVLFVCSANRDRSRTAEFISQLEYPENLYRSVGINKYLTVRSGGSCIQVEHIEWADRIVCMEPVHMKFIMDHFGSKNREKIVVLKLDKTEGGFMTEELIEQLKKCIKRECPMIWYKKQ